MRNQPRGLFWRKGVLKKNYLESYYVKLPGKILEKIPMKELIFSKVAGL